MYIDSLSGDEGCVEAVQTSVTLLKVSKSEVWNWFDDVMYIHRVNKHMGASQ